MSLRVFERLIGLFRGSEGLFCDIAVLVLLCLPLAAFAAFFALLCAGKFRARSRVWYLVLGDMCLFLFLALYLCGGSLQDAFPVLALILCVKSLYLLLYGALCLVPARPREKKVGRKSKIEPFAAEEEEISPPSAPAPKPQKVCCFTDSARVYVDKDVRLEHIFSVLDRLKEMPLGAGDRLEMQKMDDLLHIYNAKTELNAAEADALNDILAALLKMMAKYDL